ncbi:MAG: pimeloyl-ACP methyl ester carboxylesterase [Colwellia sp.]|jgi:pimeloyl-ACP methyl ester carboxylesterase
MKNHLKKTFYYGTDAQQFGHLYKPKESKVVPVVIVIHGGYWKDNHNLDSYATSAIVGYLQTMNVAIWNLEYRRMDALGENSKAPWPASFKDVAEGIDYLRNIDKVENLDLNRLLLIGHSAGGHLATWAASRKSISPDSELYRQNPLPIKSVISIAAILNLFDVGDVDQPEQIERLMGGTAKTHPGRYLTCDPSSLYEPTINITLVHGEQDTCVKVAQAKHYGDKSQGSVKQIIMSDADHFSMLPHDGFWVEDQWQQIKKLVELEIAALN